ncbi:glycine betaine ABC transporter substrate-binding protein [Chryseolinea sp. H1M3-3]|uniref:glycine betaine ABC transporter substrate-binding protein n=1 Tax=Chryseolinea sp. H1M3-3 TaxID=3034144 RepID=UPI0023ECBC10|nr:glycine betaine ABC transporter substrate-binding protein [Chryseolinea sp. H1M3-3]
MRLIFLLCCMLTFRVSLGQQTIRVGAKHFNEGYILSEMISQILEAGGYTVDRKFNLGGTMVSFEALRTGAIDVYPEYTGTIAAEILKSERSAPWEVLSAQLLNKFQLEISPPYGFNNTYALVMSAELSERLNVENISDLKNHPGLKIGVSYEFLERNDGWKNLAVAYGLPQQAIGLEHGLAYQAIIENKINITDAYATDGEINHYKLVLLKDDKEFFSAYQAVSFYSAKLPDRAKKLLNSLSSKITEAEMQQLNAKALFEKKSHSEIARSFLILKGILNQDSKSQSRDSALILKKTGEHITLTLIALLASISVAVPLGILLYRFPRLSKVALYFAGILQTIPSIALLALMIPLVGIGKLPAVIALFFYSLLPILRNTVVGLHTVDPVLKNVASGIGLNAWQKLWLVEIPLSKPMILTGIRTAAVINVGTATLAAFIGAGGLGEFIVTGLALNNMNMILTGAIPSAILAIITELVFEFIEWVAVPRHLQRRTL